jgi:hypothetical protein
VQSLHPPGARGRLGANVRRAGPRLRQWLADDRQLDRPRPCPGRSCPKRVHTTRLLGRCRGGLTSKWPIAADSFGRPVRFILIVRRRNAAQWQGKWLPGVDEDANYEFSISLLPTTPKPPKMRKRDRDRAERLRLAGGPKPSLRDRAVALAIELGTVRTRDLTDIGVPRCYLARMCEEGLLIKVGYGLYGPGRQAA